jgi:hypothetical protein
LWLHLFLSREKGVITDIKRTVEKRRMTPTATLRQAQHDKAEDANVIAISTYDKCKRQVCAFEKVGESFYPRAIVNFGPP